MEVSIVPKMVPLGLLLGTHHRFAKQNKKTVVFPATFVALQVCYGIPNEGAPKSPLK